MGMSINEYLLKDTRFSSHKLVCVLSVSAWKTVIMVVKRVWQVVKSHLTKGP